MVSVGESTGPKGTKALMASVCEFGPKGRGRHLL